MKNELANSDRRDFLKATSGALGAAVVTGFPGIIRAQTVTNAIKVGLVGCGGRGGGAARQALQADDYTELTSLADVDQSQIDGAQSLSDCEDRRSGQEIKPSQPVYRPDAFQK
jgi:Zn-dependent alcohol dehydrogenase